MVDFELNVKLSSTGKERLLMLQKLTGTTDPSLIIARSLALYVRLLIELDEGSEIIVLRRDGDELDLDLDPEEDEMVPKDKQH